MIAIRRVAFAVTACTCLVSAAFAQDREPVTVRVRYADLNLSSTSGQSELKARVRGAAEIACQATGNSLTEKMDAARCRNEMMKDGQQQAARLASPADQRLALADPR
ncbi:UrcA family protein [Sphingomonas sp. CGMCC 1.13654]|uniref:UrcA family protein n=1 Tax=Sphingomonas chungangi TaxID=2683589 RepID=A0A838LA54_9SPHN|nr:UrcA family protein [Sphingomonas chungangi]MBA2935595.1 UrcA family protein [Sphingomonas chungangi]MVW54286.1 UrcA family protein [Sphingomonas chungangi]